MTLLCATVRTKAELEAAFNDACAIVMHVVCCVSDLSLQGMAPTKLVFGRDMNVNVPVLTDSAAISANQHSQITTHPLHIIGEKLDSKSASTIVSPQQTN